MRRSHRNAREFIADIQQNNFHLDWWAAIRLYDCPVLVHLHAIPNEKCTCRRGVMDAYVAWREQNPDLAHEQDELRKSLVAGEL